MSLDIKIIETDKSKPEYQYAKKLEGIFKEAEPSINGEVIIRSNPILYGQGNREELDIVVICKLKNYLPGKIKFFKSDNKDKNKLIQLIEGDVIFTNLCFVIECKSHNTNGIQYKSETLMVKYKEGWDDATSQSREQEFTLIGYFMDKVKYSPIIANFIWLTNINSQDIKQLTGDHKKHNLLPSDFNLLWLLTLLAVQKKPFELGLKEIKSNNNNEENKEEGNRKNKRYMCTMAYQKDIDNFNECFKSFDEIKKIESVMTRDKIERITTRLLKDQQYGKSINEKLIQIQGKPGTGKTVKLLRLCYDIAMRNNNRCLILTYNKALVSDISRTLVHMKIPRKLQEEGIYIRTLHSYFFRLMRGFEIFDKNKKSVDIKFLENYDDYLNEFYEYIENEIITKEDIYKNIKSNHHELNWDYLFIDEGQDWNVKERDILYKLYGHSKILVTVGEEQKIRAPLLCDWTYQLSHDKDYVNTYSRKSLRQRSNLVNFTNGYAKHVGLNDWDVEPSDNLLGGKIIISKVSNNFDLFNKHIEECKKVGNSEYDFMFLSPPNLINMELLYYTGHPKKRYL